MAKRLLPADLLILIFNKFAKKKKKMRGVGGNIPKECARYLQSLTYQRN